MTIFKSGDLVVLKSGGPTMTVDTVNTDIFDDNKMTGILCVWFVGEKLERVRFDHRAVEPARSQRHSPRKKKTRLEEPTGDYKAVLDEMVDAMNHLAEEMCPAASRVAPKKQKSTKASKNGIVPTSTVITSVGS
jgi:uncharacterized protein YodC (DUF2158 family)